MNTPPNNGAVQLGTTRNKAASFPASKLGQLNGDPDSDQVTVQTVSATSTNGGAVTLVDGTITYTPQTNFVGTDSFEYTVSDPFSGTATGTVIVTVKQVNASPVISNITPQPDGNMQLQANGLPGYTYLIQATTDFQTWSNIATNAALSNGLIIFTDLEATNYSGRYYRLAQP